MKDQDLRRNPFEPLRKFDIELMRFRFKKRRKWGWRRYFQDKDKRLVNTISVRIDQTEQTLFKLVCDHYREHQQLRKSDVLRLLIVQEAEKLGFWRPDDNES